MSTKQVMTISESAANRVKALIARQGGDENLKLRVSISGGGCAGFTYGFSFDPAQNPDDEVVTGHGVTVVIDGMSLLYVIGGEIDFKEGVVGSAFRINNPNAASTCGCGTSFAI